MRPVTISSKYQVVIPREIREQLNLRPGQKLAFIPYNGTLRVVIVPSIEEAYGMLKGLNTDDIREEDDKERG
jgi:AbrB family looped-hinge helix DNA binding protein